jgi:hypothetical protein
MGNARCPRGSKPTIPRVERPTHVLPMGQKMRTNALTKNLQLFCSLRLRPSPKSLAPAPSPTTTPPQETCRCLKNKPGEVLRRAPLEARLAAPTPSPGTIPPLPSPCKHIACSSATYHGSIVPVIIVDGHLHHPEPLDHRKLPLAAAPSATGGNNVLRQEQRGPPPEATPSNCGSNVALLRE